jgi:hypothetical protein
MPLHVEPLFDSQEGKVEHARFPFRPCRKNHDSPLIAAIFTERARKKSLMACRRSRSCEISRSHVRLQKVPSTTELFARPCQSYATHGSDLNDLRDVSAAPEVPNRAA